MIFEQANNSYSSNPHIVTRKQYIFETQKCTAVMLSKGFRNQALLFHVWLSGCSMDPNSSSLYIPSEHDSSVKSRNINSSLAEYQGNSTNI